MSTKHDKVAQRLARRERTSYNKGPGPDVNTARRAVEVETRQTVGDAGRQLQGFNKPVYVAGADANATADALKTYKSTTIGVMNSKGQVLKRSTRKRK